jgi:hypothetical protein
LIERWRHLVRLIWHGELPTHEAWGVVLETARESAMLPLVAFLVLEQETLLPQYAVNCLREARRSAVARQVAAAHQIEQLAQIASSLDMRVILLKGPVVARAYPRSAARLFTDLDVLVVSRSAALALSDALQACGYEPLMSSRAFGQVTSLCPQRAGLPIDIHYSLGEGKWMLPMAKIWERACPSGDRFGFWEMEEIDHALYLMAHAMGHTLGQGLRWLYDLTCWTREWDETVWKNLVARARDWGVEPTVQLTGALWMWAREESWDALPFAALLQPPPAEITALARRALLGEVSSRLPGIWRDGAGRGISGWLHYVRDVLTRGRTLNVVSLPQRLAYLVRQHGPALWQLLRGDSGARESWDNQRRLYDWLRGEKGATR